MKQRLKLRNWVKVVLVLIVIGGLMIALNNYTEKAINQCVEAGNSYNYCVNGLAK